MFSFLKKFRDSKFIGQQLSRLKMGQSYYTLLMSTITAVMTIKFVYPNIQLEWLIAGIPVALLGTFYLGYYMDQHNINSLDVLKSNEMTHRFLNTGDMKNQEFQLLQTRLMFEAIKALKNDEDLDVNIIREKYQEYVDKWQYSKEIEIENKEIQNTPLSELQNKKKDREN